MSNAKLIEALRCKTSDVNDCKMCAYYNACYAGKLESIAADAIEAAEQRIADLSLDNKMLKNTIDADKGIMLDRIRFLEAQIPKDSEWIPCSERLPEEGSYLVWMPFAPPKHRIAVAEYCGYWTIKTPIAAWMPLPEEWKGEK